MQTGHKLKSAADFERARKSRRRVGDALFLVQGAENGGDTARLGMAVSVRAIGGAVRRNRVRRLIREYFRLHRQELIAVDLFVTARDGAKSATNAEIRASLQRLCQEIGTKS